jgi:serine/threonine-protein kinase RsbW
VFRLARRNRVAGITGSSLGTGQSTTEPMAHESENNRYVASIVIDSDTAQGQRIQSDIVTFAQRCQFSEPELFAIRLAVEEALVNAIKHGNGSDPSKKVRIDYCVDTEQVHIRIEDEGPGFNPSDVPDPTDPEYLERPCGRGLMLMRHYMSCVEFSGRGNCVIMLKRRGEVKDNGDDE